MDIGLQSIDIISPYLIVDLIVLIANKKADIAIGFLLTFSYLFNRNFHTSGFS